MRKMEMEVVVVGDGGGGKLGRRSRGCSPASWPEVVAGDGVGWALLEEMRKKK